MLAEFKIFHLLFSLAEIQMFILIWLSQSFRFPTYLELFFFFLASVSSAILTMRPVPTHSDIQEEISQTKLLYDSQHGLKQVVEDMDPLKYSSNYTI